MELRAGKGGLLEGKAELAVVPGWSWDIGFGLLQSSGMQVCHVDFRAYRVSG